MTEDSSKEFFKSLQVYDPVAVFASKSNFEDVIGKLVLKQPIDYSSSLGLQDTTQQLLKREAELRMTSEDDERALNIACAMGHYELCSTSTQGRCEFSRCLVMCCCWGTRSNSSTST
ncbi:hypothetical protein N431DRAFT_143918 [Stipitochalara longipes BDJ]|nr:hypothetical protein N431DRAFT_143918 [Stipitochalara longipes BDJ]